MKAFYKGMGGTIIPLVHHTGDLLSIALGGALLVCFKSDHSIQKDSILFVLFTLLIASPIFRKMGVYKTWRGGKFFKEFNTVVSAWIVTYLITVFLFFIIDIRLDPKFRSFQIWFSLSTIAPLVLIRGSIRLSLNHLRSRGFNKLHVGVVGKDQHAVRVIQAVMRDKWTGINIRGYFAPGIFRNLSVPKLGNFGDIEKYLRNSDLDEIWIALQLSEQNELEGIMDQLKFSTVNVKLIPDVFGFQLINHSVSEIGNFPVISLSQSPLTGWNYVFKEIEDKVISFFILLMISPIMLGLALAVKLTSKGPIFYKQERISWNGKPFNMLKFRSMHVDNEKDGVQWGGAKNKGLTPIGGFIRKTSLDELPQFLNVLMGDMSIVGPRPERPMFVDQFKHEIPGYMQKHLVKAGITGWAQINGWRGDTDLNMRIKYDLMYIKNWSLWFDIKIIFLTLFKGFVHKNSG